MGDGECATVSCSKETYWIKVHKARSMAQYLTVSLACSAHMSSPFAGPLAEKLFSDMASARAGDTSEKQGVSVAQASFECLEKT